MHKALLRRSSRPPTSGANDCPPTIISKAYTACGPCHSATEIARHVGIYENPTFPRGPNNLNRHNHVCSYVQEVQVQGHQRLLTRTRDYQRLTLQLLRVVLRTQANGRRRLLNATMRATYPTGRCSLIAIMAPNTNASGETVCNGMRHLGMPLRPAPPPALATRAARRK